MKKEVFKFTSVGQFARRGALKTRAGGVSTPVFMPVGTRGAVKGLTPGQVKATGAQIILGNTYHLHLQPGEKTVRKLGGLHGFSGWQGPILTDSGGFQVFSLAKHRKITEDGVTFRDPASGDKVFLSPEKAIQIQIDLGSDIIMAFDDVTGLDKKARGRQKEAVERTHRWLERCVKEFRHLTKDMATPGSSVVQADAGQGADEQRREPYREYGERVAESATPTGAASANSVGGSAGKQVSAVNKRERPLLFGIAQGGLDRALRQSSLEFIQSQPVDGIAIGGLAVGESRREMYDMLDFLAPMYDPKRPHYLMGVGEPSDFRYAIERGIDMVDCVMATRNGRHATAWVKGDKKIHLTNARFAEDAGPIDPDCDCTTCTSGYSRGFLRHQFKVGESLAGSLVSIHNIRYLNRIAEEYKRG